MMVLLLLWLTLKDTIFRLARGLDEVRRENTSNGIKLPFSPNSGNDCDWGKDVVWLVWLWLGGFTTFLLPPTTALGDVRNPRSV